jgi:hypothetical protein
MKEIQLKLNVVSEELMRVRLLPDTPENAQNIERLQQSQHHWWRAAIAVLKKQEAEAAAEPKMSVSDSKKKLWWVCKELGRARELPDSAENAKYILTLEDSREKYLYAVEAALEAVVQKERAEAEAKRRKAR